MRHLPTVVLVVISFGVDINGRQATPRGAPARRPIAEKPSCAVAAIDRKEFFHAGKGLALLAHGNEGLYKEFQRLRDELALLKRRRGGIHVHLVKVSGPEEGRRALREQLEALDQEIGRREQELRSTYEGRVLRTLEPFAGDVDEALREMAKERGYALVIEADDLSRTLLYIGEGCDITREFIEAFNRRHRVVTR